MKINILFVLLLTLFAAPARADFDYSFIYQHPARAMSSFDDANWTALRARVHSGGFKVPGPFWIWFAGQVQAPENGERVRQLMSDLNVPQQIRLAENVADSNDPALAENLLHNPHTLESLNRLVRGGGYKNRILAALRIANLSRDLPASFRQALQTSTARSSAANLMDASDDSYIQPLFEHLNRHPEDFTVEMYRDVFKNAVLHPQDMIPNPAMRASRPTIGPGATTSPSTWLAAFLKTQPDWPKDAALKAEIYADYSNPDGRPYGYDLRYLNENRADLREAHRRLVPRPAQAAPAPAKTTLRDITDALPGSREWASNWQAIVERGPEFWTPEVLTLLRRALGGSVHAVNFSWLLRRMSTSSLAELPAIQEFLRSTEVQGFINKAFHSGHFQADTIGFILSRPELLDRYRAQFTRRLKTDQATKFARDFIGELNSAPRFLREHPEWQSVLIEGGLNSSNITTREVTAQGLLGFSERPYSPLQEEAAAIAARSLRTNPIQHGNTLYALGANAQDFLQEHVLPQLNSSEVAKTFQPENMGEANAAALVDYMILHPENIPQLSFRRDGNVYRMLLERAKAQPLLLENQNFCDALFGRAADIGMTGRIALVHEIFNSDVFRNAAFPYLNEEGIHAGLFPVFARLAVQEQRDDQIKAWETKMREAGLEPSAAQQGIIREYPRYFSPTLLAEQKSTFPKRILLGATHAPELDKFLEDPEAPENTVRMAELAEAFKDAAWVKQLFASATGVTSGDHKGRLFELLSTDGQLLDKALIRAQLEAMPEKQLREYAYYCVDGPTPRFRSGLKLFFADYMDVLDRRLSLADKVTIIRKNQWPTFEQGVKLEPTGGAGTSDGLVAKGSVKKTIISQADEVAAVHLIDEALKTDGSSAVRTEVAEAFNDATWIKKILLKLARPGSIAYRQALLRLLTSPNPEYSKAQIGAALDLLTAEQFNDLMRVAFDDRVPQQTAIQNDLANFLGEHSAVVAAKMQKKGTTLFLPAHWNAAEHPHDAVRALAEKLSAHTGGCGPAIRAAFPPRAQ